MKRPRRPKKVEATELPAPTPRELCRQEYTIGPVDTAHGFEWIRYPDDFESREQYRKSGLRPVENIDFGGILPSKGGFVHFQGLTLMRRIMPVNQMTTASLGGSSKFIVISLTISEKN